MVVERYRQHIIPAHVSDERLASPASRAHAVIDNHQIASPKIVSLDPFVTDDERDPELACTCGVSA